MEKILWAIGIWNESYNDIWKVCCFRGWSSGECERSILIAWEEECVKIIYMREVLMWEILFYVIDVVEDVIVHHISTSIKFFGSMKWK